MSTSRQPWQRLRRVFLWAIIVSFSIAALSGIAVLLGAELGDTAMRVIISTPVVGAYCLAMLACGALLDRPERVIGGIGIGVTALSLVYSLILIWVEGEGNWIVFQVLLSGITLTVGFSFVSLLLALTRYRDRLIQVLIPVTLALFVIATAILLWFVWEGPGIDTDFFGRALGIILILVVLCGVSTPILSTLRRKASGEPAPRGVDTENYEQTTEAASGASAMRIDPETAAALEAQAQRRGISVAELVAPVLRE